MRAFGDFTNEQMRYDSAEIAILPVPYDGTSTWIKGADRGPEAILDASYNLEFYDIETATEVYKRGIATLEPVTEASSPEAMADEVERRMEQILHDGKFPVLIGGEHSVSIGAFRAMARRYSNLSILQLDAHSDMRDEYEGSPCNHACVMARAKSLHQISHRSAFVVRRARSCIISIGSVPSMPTASPRMMSGLSAYLRSWATMSISLSTSMSLTLPTSPLRVLPSQVVLPIARLWGF